MTYRADIDGLRAIAVLLVLIFHFDLLGLGAGGFIGVDIFFVISGYLISRIIWQSLGEGCFDLWHFYAQRIRRLAPALIVVQLAVLAVAFVTLLPAEMLSLAKEIALVQVYVSNIYYWQSLNYFDLHTSSSFMLHTWSLGVEEQFYLFFPVLLIAVHRFARTRVVPVLVVITLASFALNLALVGPKPEATFYLLPTRAWELLLGALLSHLEPRVANKAWLRRVAGPVALGLIVGALAIHGPGIRFPGWFALLPAAAGVLLILAGASAGSPVSRLLATPAMVWVGRISYPLYLVHWPIHTFALTLLPAYGLSARWAMLGLSFACAYAIFRWVERGFRNRSWLPGDREMFFAYLTATALVLAIVGSAWTSGGWRFRFSPEVLRAADVADDHDSVGRQLAYGGGPIDQWLRPIGAQGAPAHWLVVGDSHAGALAEAASLWLGGRGEAGSVVYASGCLPVVNSGTSLCRSFNRATQDYVREHGEIGAVMVVSSWRQPIEPGYTDASGRVVSGKPAIAAFDAALHATLAGFRQLGVEVYVWEPLPAMPGNVPVTLARNMIFGEYRPVAIARSEHEATFRFLSAALDREAPLIAGRVRPDRTMCLHETCTAIDLGAPLYHDNNHPAAGQAKYFSEILAREMAKAPPARGYAGLP